MTLQTHILSSLRSIPDHLMLPVSTLWAEVRMKMAPQPSFADFEDALRVLEEEKRQIVVIRGEDQVRAKITDLGKARLQALN